MRAALTVGGVLGAGTVLVFGLAAATAALFPNGATVGASFDGSFGGGAIAPAVGVPNGGWQKIVNADGSVVVVGPGQPVPVPAPIAKPAPMPAPTEEASPSDAGG